MPIDSQHPRLEEQIARYAQQAAPARRTSVPWRHFAAAAGATLGVASSAEAVIVSMTPTSPIRLEVPSIPTVTMSNATTSASNATEFDLNGDAINDFKLLFFNYAADYTDTAAGIQSSTFARGILLDPLNDASVAGGATSSSSFSSASRFAAGNQIDGSFTFVRGSAVMIAQTSFNGGGMRTGSLTGTGEWAASDDAFAGVLLEIGGNDHYGWIRLKLTQDEFGWVDSIEVLGWAYEDVPDTPIAAGDTGTPSGTPGDFNGDGMVDLADYTVWRDNLGADESVLPAGSGDGSNTVDAGDYDTWKSNFGTPGSAGALTANVQVPEPSTISLGALALGAAGVTALRRQQQRK